MKKNGQSYTMADVAEYARIRDEAARNGDIGGAREANDRISLALREIADSWLIAGKSTRSQKLALALSNIAQRHGDEIASLEYRGPRGGTNAKHIPGWRCLGNAAITRAAGLARVPQMSYWSGSAPTPSTALPACMADEAVRAYELIFKI